MNFLKIFSVIGVAFCCLSEAAYCDDLQDGSAEIVFDNNVVAIVNGKIVTKQQIRMEVAPIVGRLQSESNSEAEFFRKLSKLEHEVLHDIVDRMVIVEAFNERGGQLQKTYIDKEFNSFIDKNFDGDRVKFIEYLQAYGKSAREFREELKNRAIVRFMYHEISDSQTSVSPAKIKEFYEANADKFFANDIYDLNQIVILKDSSDTSVVLEKSKNLMRDLSAGMSFSDASKLYNDAPSNFHIDNVQVTDLIAEYSEAVKTTVVGTYSKLIDLNNCFVVLEVVSLTPAHKVSLSEASNNIEDYLNNKYQQEAREKWLNQLREKAAIQIFM